VEAADVSGAHQASYGREAAAVLAAAVAEAVRPGATVTSVVDTALRFAHDGTRTAIDAVAAAASGLRGWRGGGLQRLRDAFVPFDSVGEHYANPSLGARIPSRLQSIEELPIAIGLLVATSGDFAETVLGGVNYGRDSDSIASMGGALAGALGGTAALRADWTDQVAAASRYDLEEPGRVMARVATEIFERDAERHARRAGAMAALTSQPSLDHVTRVPV
jgi:ADP-ribosylglycohydrolase